jgi:hypothetical protein
MIGGCQGSPARPVAQAWAFCGVNPTDPLAQRKANSLAKDAGINVTFGPCLPPPSDYTAANPGSRYLPPDQYLALTVINANAGMKTVVYDARIWSDDPAVRQEAIDFWLPHVSWMAAWDMGDEFDPGTSDWGTLVYRWETVRTYVAPVTGVQPFTNHLGSSGVLSAALADLPGSEQLLSFDAYPEVNGRMVASLALASEFQGKTANLMCAINALPHGSFVPTASSIRRHMNDHRKVGCDSYLIFGGEMPINTAGFTKPSLINKSGKPTSLAAAVKSNK